MMATIRINNNAYREVKLEKNSATTFAEVTFDCKSLNAMSRRALISSWVWKLEPRWGLSRECEHESSPRLQESRLLWANREEAYPLLTVLERIVHVYRCLET
jgi:hypothetical protein